MRRYLFAALAAVLVGVFVFPVGAGAGIKVDVCHIEGNGSYHLINISENAFAKHVDHGDGSPGDVVPGMDGFVFGENCVTELAGPAHGCYEHDTDGKQDLLYLGPVDTVSNIQSSNTTDGSCSLATGSGLALVLANDAVEAEAKCAVLNGTLQVSGLSLFDFGYSGFPPNAWICLGTS